MCLHPHSIHNNENNRYYHRITTRPIAVWKVLYKRTTTIYESPFQSAIWIAGKLLTVSDMKFSTNYDISEGLHAFRSRYKAREVASFRENRIVRPAIIPTGSKNWFGSNRDICSDAMIVFQNMKELEKVYGKITEPVHYSILSK